MDLDFRGEECPVSTIKTVERLKRLDSENEIVTVVVDDATCAKEIPYQANRLGYTSETTVTGISEWTIRLMSGNYKEINLD